MITNYFLHVIYSRRSGHGTVVSQLPIGHGVHLHTTFTAHVNSQCKLLTMNNIVYTEVPKLASPHLHTRILHRLPYNSDVKNSTMFRMWGDSHRETNTSLTCCSNSQSDTAANAKHNVHARDTSQFRSLRSDQSKTSSFKLMSKTTTTRSSTTAGTHFFCHGKTTRDHRTKFVMSLW